VNRGGRHHRLAVVLAAASPLLVLGLLATPALGSAAAAPTVTIASDWTKQPATNLYDGQFLHLQFKGFPGGAGLALSECTAPPASPADYAANCNDSSKNPTPVMDATGSGDAFFPVHTTDNLLALASAGGTGPIACDATHACGIAAIQDSSTFLSTVFVPVTFAPTATSCPSASPGTSLLGGGSASANRALYAWSSSVCRPPANIPVTYTSNNPVVGASSFFDTACQTQPVCHGTDFAASGPFPPFSSVAQSTPQPWSPAYQNAPLSASAVVLAYRMYDAFGGSAGNQITNLQLTPTLIAKIFTGQIIDWNTDDPEIKALNPGVRQFPGEVFPFTPAEYSDQTYEFTSWLSQSAPAVWTCGTVGGCPKGTRASAPAGAQAVFTVPSPFVAGITGSASLGLKVLDPANTVDYSQLGQMAFMDSSVAAFYGLPTVQIKLDGGAVVQAKWTTLPGALAEATVNSDGTVTPNYATTDSYPMPIVTDMLAPTSTISSARGAVLAAFLRYAVQSGQSNLPPGYSVLPATLSSLSLNVANGIPGANQSPSPSPSPTASAAGFSPTALSTPSLPAFSAAAQPAATPKSVAAKTCVPAHRSACAAGKAVATAANAPVSLLVAGTAIYVLPAVVALAALGLVAGVAAQAVARYWRRATKTTQHV